MAGNISQPNIVLVSIDSLRADHCGYLGSDRGLTPTLDSLAEDGVAFQNAIAPGPQTFSSMPAVFTGFHRPRARQLSDPDVSHWERQLAALDRHLATYSSLSEGLAGLGYRTVGLSPNPWTSTRSGWDRGFDRFVDLTGHPDSLLHRIADRIPWTPADGNALDLLLDLMTGRSFFAQWDQLYDRLQSTLEDMEAPYFLWLFLLDTHFPFIARRPDRTEQGTLRTYASNVRAAKSMRGNDGTLSAETCAAIRRSYRDTVRAVDGFLARLHDDLAADDPVYFIHADHGESFGEHGVFGHRHAQVYEENIHVPYVVANAGVTADIQEPTSLATVHDSILTTARSGTFRLPDAADQLAFARSVHGTRRAVRGRRFKLVECDGDQSLFDLEQDPDEARDCSDDQPAVAREFKRALSTFERHVDETARMGRASTTMAANGGF